MKKGVDLGIIEFDVPGIPVPGGSKRYVGHSRAGRAILVDTAGQRNKDWRTSVQVFAVQAKAKPLSGPLHLVITFYMPRPKSHYGTGKNADILKPNAPRYHTSAPDATKLTRSTEDALKGICWVDDSQVAVQTITKYYGTPGAHIKVVPLPTEGDR